MTAYVVTYQLRDDVPVVNIFLTNQKFSFIVGNLEPGVEYTFTVSAQSAQGELAMTNVTLSTPGRQPPYVLYAYGLHDKVCFPSSHLLKT